MNNKNKNILIPIDQSCESSWEHSLPVAVDLARSHQAVLHVVSVMPEVELPAVAALLPNGMDRKILEEGARGLKTLIRKHIPEDIDTEIQVRQGRPYKEILKVAEKLKVDLIVMASHRPRLSDYLIGANAAYVTRHATCSVMVVREPKKSKA
ncbi:universal stress protein [Endozoicomonas sp. YOMI1]|uniref:universal stress protein n=1 Tax=Endozoicomonas sp. YOMI1 TaxID=2828739 RepID=UPI0021498D38|nr:universal stress protein [Endozoicomonas sp. YOMI1]